MRIDAGLPEIAASVDASADQSGYDVDVTIAEAGIAPSRAHLPTHEQFATAQHDRLAAQLLDLLKAEYSRRYCTAETYTIEEAARCGVAPGSTWSLATRATRSGRFSAARPPISGRC